MTTRTLRWNLDAMDIGGTTSRVRGIGTVIKRTLKGLGSEITEDYRNQFPCSAEIGKREWLALCAAHKDAKRAAEERCREADRRTATEKHCARCGATTRTGAMFTTLRTVCDDCA